MVRLGAVPLKGFWNTRPIMLARRCSGHWVMSWPSREIDPRSTMKLPATALSTSTPNTSQRRALRVLLEHDAIQPPAPLGIDLGAGHVAPAIARERHHGSKLHAARFGCAEAGGGQSGQSGCCAAR